MSNTRIYINDKEYTIDEYKNIWGPDGRDIGYIDQYMNVWSEELPISFIGSDGYIYGKQGEVVACYSKNNNSFYSGTTGEYIGCIDPFDIGDIDKKFSGNSMSQESKIESEKYEKSFNIPDTDGFFSYTTSQTDGSSIIPWVLIVILIILGLTASPLLVLYFRFFD